MAFRIFISFVLLRQFFPKKPASSAQLGGGGFSAGVSHGNASTSAVHASTVDAGMCAGSAEPHPATLQQTPDTVATHAATSPSATVPHVDAHEQYVHEMA
jgi:hypothetical protein